jgi:hypothetical protein
MLQRFLLLSGLVLAGCGGEDDGGAVSCERSDRTGTYLGTYVERSGGTCGALPDELARLDASEPADGYGTCAKASADVWSDGDCTLERSLECDDGSSGVAISTQQDSSGEHIEGTLTLRVPGVCTSTYDVDIVRQ